MTMRYSKSKEISAIVQNKISNGWQFVKGEKHGKIIAPNGRRIPVPGTPSDYRAWLNFKRDVRLIELSVSR